MHPNNPNNPNADLLMWMVSFLCVLFCGVEVGILCAVLVSLFIVVVEQARARSPPGPPPLSFRPVVPASRSAALAIIPAPPTCAP